MPRRGMNDLEKLTRRNFFKSVTQIFAVGASTCLFPDSAVSEPKSQNWTVPFDPKSVIPTHYPREMPKPGEKIHEFSIELSVNIHEIIPGVKVHAFTYNGTLPGPEIRVPENDWVLVNFTNRTPELHTIHWHGINLANEMDGVPLGTQWGTGMNQTFRYLFRAQPAGTHHYHCHNMTPLHIQSGMFGALIIIPKRDIIREIFPYQREYTLILSEIDTNFVETAMNDMLTRMQLMQSMLEDKNLMNEMNGKMMGWFYDKKAYIKAIQEGNYIPPYSKAAAGRFRKMDFDYYMINGKSYPMTDNIFIRKGENIRIRLINSGMLLHSIHIHGHDFWHVCTDGSPLASPIRLNTVPVFPGGTVDLIIQGCNPGHWHLHDHSDISSTNNGQFPGGIMTMLVYEDAHQEGVNFREVIQVSS